MPICKTNNHEFAANPAAAPSQILQDSILIDLRELSKSSKLITAMEI